MTYYERSIAVKDGARVKFTLPNLNKHGWGVVYANLQIGAKRIRLSTSIRVKREYWSDGDILNPRRGSLADGFLHDVARTRLKETRERIDKEIFGYLNGLTDEVGLENHIINFFKSLKTMNKTQPKSIIRMLRATADKTENSITRKNEYSYIQKFVTFLDAKGLEDSMETMTIKTMTDFRNWLCEVVQPSTARNVLTNFKKIVKAAQISNALDFHINWDMLARIKDARTSEDKKANYVAMTHDHLKRLETLELKGREAKVRDLFLILCYCGVRIEDLNKLLASENHEESEGIRYAIFKSTKTKTTHHIPLNDPTLYPNTYDLMRPYLNNPKPTDEKFNHTLKAVAKKAGFDEVVKQTDSRGNVTEMPLYKCISSHWGRHTLVTNLQRYFHMEAKQVKFISGHATTALIESTYTNTTLKDRLTLIGVRKRAVEPKATNNTEALSDMDEGKRVLRFFGSEKEATTFEDVAMEIRKHEGMLLDEYGVSVATLKGIFNLPESIVTRKRLLGTLLGDLEGAGLKVEKSLSI